MDATNLARYHAIIEGRVQGVGFRMFVKQKADQYRLAGWVRNTWQGEVEVLVEGPRNSIEHLITDLRVGPPSAYVTNLREDWTLHQGEFTRFIVARSE